MTLVAVTFPLESTVSTFCVNAGEPSARTSRSTSILRGSTDPCRPRNEERPEAIVSAMVGQAVSPAKASVARLGSSYICRPEGGRCQRGERLGGQFRYDG